MALDADSILDTVKKSLGIDSEFEAFDPDIVMHINSTFTTLHQLGVGVSGFSIQDRSAKWTEFYSEGKNLEAIRSYVYAKVRIIFDPPATAYGIQSFEKYCNELEWRLNALVETEHT